jgi:TonB family protein
MNPLRAFAFGILLLVLPCIGQTQNVRWFEVTSANFILFTDTTEAKGRRLVTDLEQRIASFQNAFGVVPKRQFPIEILLFKHSEDFLAPAPTPTPPDTGIDAYNSAYVLRGADRIFIVAQDNSPDDIANEVGHDLGHLFLDRTVLWHPFWLEEASAEYFRKVGRNPENKRIVPADRIPVDDILSIVPSGTYKDSDPAGPFRIQSYRFLRIVLDEHAAELRAYINALKAEAGRDSRLSIEAGKATEELNQFVDTRIPPGAAPSDILSREVPAAAVSVHRGDVMVAAHKNTQASMWYEGDSDDARAARAIFAKLTNGSEAVPMLTRTAADFPDRGLVQYYFGSIESQDATVITNQIEALERAVRLLPLMGRAQAELARVLTIGFRAEEALPLLDRAVALEPEYADRFYILRADTLVVLRRYDEAYKTAKLAAALPHADRTASATYNQKVVLLDQKIQDIRIDAERLQVNQLQESVAAEAARREPVRPPAPPPQPDRAGQIDYQYEATNPVEILKQVLPEYPDALVKKGKAGKISLQVNIGKDGVVANASVTESQIQEMNDDTIAAVKKWTFKPLIRAGQPVAFSIKLIFNYSIQ